MVMQEPQSFLRPPAPPSAVHEARGHQQRLEAITNLHTGARPSVNWQSMATQAPPTPPTFKPTRLEQLLKNDALSSAVHRRRAQAFQRAHRRWKARRASATAILRGLPEAYRALLETHDTFAALRKVGATASIGDVRPNGIEVIVHAGSEHVVPQNDISLLANGKLAVKPIGPQRYKDLVRTYRSGAALRAARDIFALLPVSYVLVQMWDDDLDETNGHMDEWLVLSALFDRPTLAGLNVDLVDPAAAMRNFRHERSQAAGELIQPAPAMRLKDEIPEVHPAPPDVLEFLDASIPAPAPAPVPIPVPPPAPSADRPSSPAAGDAGDTGRAVSPPRDAGLAVVCRTLELLLADDEWSQREERGFTWWPERLAQRVWAEPPRMSRGRYVSKLHARTQVLRDVPDRPQTYETLAALNQRSALSAWVFDPVTRTVDMHAIAYVNVAVEKQIFAWFSQAATLQAAEAHHHVDALAAALKAAVATSHVPDGPARTIPDDLLGIFAETARRSEASGSSPILHEDVFERLEIFEPHPWVLASSNAESMIAELPWNDIVPAPLSHRPSPTALLHVRSNQSHPQLGAGVLATLTLPIAVADGPRLANRLNLAAIEAWNDAHLLGAWCHRDTVAFATFMPGTQWLGRPANEQALLLYNLALNHKAFCDWSRELITEADLAPDTPAVPATPPTPPVPLVAERTDEDALVAAESAAIETRDDTTEAQGANGGVPVVEDDGDSSTPNGQAADHASTAAARSATASTATPTAPSMREDLAPYRVTELAPLATSLTFDDPAAQLLVEQQILDVVEAEGPIVAKLVRDRLCEAWGIVPAASTVRGAFEQAVRTLERRHRLQHSASGTLALPHTTLTLVRVPDGDDPRTARTVAQVPPRELRLAIEHVTAEAEQQPLAKDALFAAIAELFGWPDRSATIDSALEMALAGLVHDGRVVIDADGGGVRLGT